MIQHYADDSAPFAPVAISVRYWRVRWLNTFAGTYAVIANVEFRQVLNTPEQATGGVASASSFYLSDPTYNADKAFDANDSTVWNSQDGGFNSAWIKYAFATPRSVEQLMMRASAVSAIHSPTQFVLEYSADDVTWNPKYTGGPVTWTNGEAKAFNV